MSCALRNKCTIIRALQLQRIRCRGLSKMRLTPKIANSRKFLIWNLTVQEQALKFKLTRTGDISKPVLTLWEHLTIYLRIKSDCQLGSSLTKILRTIPSLSKRSYRLIENSTLLHLSSFIHSRSSRLVRKNPLLKKSVTIQLVGKFHQKLLKLKITDLDPANF